MSASPLRRFKPALDTLEAREVPAVITVTGTGDTIAVDGFVTLREALTAANTNAASGDAGAGDPGLDTIKFNISGLPGTVHTIQPTGALPSITEAAFIDGYSQLGASANTLVNGDNAFLAIELDGTNAGFHAGLHISGGGSTVQGLVINRFSNEGILITSGGGNTIVGNFLGTDATGKLDRGNGISGVALLSSNNTVGGTDPASRNLISGNDFAGIALLNSGINGNVIQGNFIGTDDTGAAPLGNGGPAGVRILNVTGNTVGGTAPGAGNVIAFNAGSGVQVSIDAGPGNAILGNSIFANGKLGIDINDDGVTPNDPLDADTGPNGLQNFPTLVSAYTGATGTTIQGKLHGAPNTLFRFEFFSNDDADPSGAGEGQRFLGLTFASTDASGNATFTFKPATPIAFGQLISATATDVVTKNTSEFSVAIAVTEPPVVFGSAATHLFAVGAGPGVPGLVKVFNPDGSLRFNLLPFGGYAGGVRVATGDVTGDGVEDVVVGAGAGAPGGHVKVFDGTTGAEVRSFFAFPGFTGGVSVAAGDVNHDGVADIVVGAGAGAPGGHVKVFDGASGAEIRSFFAFPGFGGGVNVAAGDLDGDGFAEIVVGTATGSSHVKAFDGATGALVRSFFAFPGFPGGVNVSAGDIDGDSRADIIVGAGPGAGPHVKVFNGATGAEVRSFFALPPGSTAGVRVAADDLDGDGGADLLTGAGLGAQVRGFRGTDLAPLRDFLALDGSLPGGVFVG